jgi:hypothetical protein
VERSECVFFSGHGWRRCPDLFFRERGREGMEIARVCCAAAEMSEDIDRFARKCIIEGGCDQAARP